MKNFESCHYIGSREYDIRGIKKEYNIAIVILRINKIAHICDNHISIYLPFAHSIEFNNNHIHQSNSTDIVITMSGILCR